MIKNEIEERLQNYVLCLYIYPRVGEVKIQ